MLGQHNQQRFMRNNLVTHYKAYKVGKHWVFAGLTALTFGASIFLSGTASVKADTVSDAETTTQVVTVADASAGAAIETATTMEKVTDQPAISQDSDGNDLSTTTNELEETTSATPKTMGATVPDARVADTTRPNLPAITDDSPQVTAKSTVKAQLNTSNASEPAYQTPKVKSGITPTASIAPTTASSGQKVTTAGTNFTLNFTAEAGDTVKVYIDGADTDSPEFAGGASHYMSVTNVTKATMGVTTTTSTNIGSVPSITNTITQGGSYAQSFDLALSYVETQYSTTATAKSEVAVDKKIVVKINDAEAASYTYSVTHNLVPIHLLQSSTYQPMTVYSDEPVTVALPGFGTSDDSYPKTISSDSLTKLNAETATFDVAMPVGFELDATATAALNTTRGFKIEQAADSSDILVQYDATTMTQPETGSDAIYVVGAFKGYSSGTSLTSPTGNVLTVVTKTGETLSSTSAKMNVFNYAPDNAVEMDNTPQYDFSNPGSEKNVEYVSVKRAAAKGDQLVVPAGILNYYGPAVKDATETVTIPAGFSAQTITVEVPDKLLTETGKTALAYQVIYTDGTQSSGNLASGTNNVPLTPDKTVATLSYQYDIPAIVQATVQMGAIDEDSGKYTSGVTAHGNAYYAVPTAELTLTVDDGVTVGDYQLDATIAGVNGQGKAVTIDTPMILRVTGATYVTTNELYDKTQTSTSAGDVLTADNTTFYGTGSSGSLAGRQLSDGQTSTQEMPVEQYLNQPIVYMIAPAQTHLIMDEVKLLNDWKGAVVSTYKTASGLSGYKIDLTQAISESRSDYNMAYRDPQSMAVKGVFFNSGGNGLLQELLYAVDIQADPDATTGSDDLRMYYTVTDQVQDITNGLDTDGAMTGDPNAVAIKIGEPTYAIKNMSGIYGVTMVQGSKDSSHSRTGTASVYQPLANNQFAVNVQNLTGTALTNVTELVNLPADGDALGSTFDVQLTGAATNLPTGVTVLYSTSSQDQQSGSLAEPDPTGYVAADAVTDWSTIKSMLIQTPALAANTSLGRVIFTIQDANQLTDIGKTAYFDSGTYADGLPPIVLNKLSSASLMISGQATVNYAYQLPDGSTVPAPELSRIYTVGTDTLTLPAISNTDVPTGYRLLDATTGKALMTSGDVTSYQVGSVVNSTADYSQLGGTNGLAVLKQVVNYDADGDTVLIPVVDTASQTVTVNYVDDTTQTTLATKTLTGESLTPVVTDDGKTAYVTGPTIATYVKAGYQQVSDATNGTALTFDDDTTQSPTYDVHLKHGTALVTATTPGVAGNLIPNTTTQWPAGVATTDLSKTITRTVSYVYGDDQSIVAKSVVQTADFTRAAVVDKVTGALLGYLPETQVATYQADPTAVTLTATDGWSAAVNLTAVTSPTTEVKANYLPDVETVPALTVTPNDTDSTVTVTYDRVAKTIGLVYYNDSDYGKILERLTFDGYVGEQRDYEPTFQATMAKYSAMGYILDKMQGNTLTIPAHQMNFYDLNREQLTGVHLKHGLIAVTPTTPETPGDVMANGTSTWPAEVGDLSRTVTQTITYDYADDTGEVAPDNVQSVTYQRAAIVDAFSGEFLGYMAVDEATDYVAYQNLDKSLPATLPPAPTSQPVSDGGWEIMSGAADFGAVTSPTADKRGYTADLAATPAVTVMPTTGSSQLTITYAPDTQVATVSYVDDDAAGAQVHVDTLTGVSNGTQDYGQVQTAIQGGLAALGYVTAGTDLPADHRVTFDDDDATPQPYVVHLTHGTTVVMPDQPEAPTADVTGTQASDLNRTVTQTVSYVYAGGGKVTADRTQSVSFARAAVVDQVTGQLLGYLAPSEVAAYEADADSVTLSPTDGWAATAGEATFTPQVSLVATGYTPDVVATEAYAVTPTTGDLKLTVTYNPDTQVATVTYVDDDADGAQIHQDTINDVTFGTHDYSAVRSAITGGLTQLGYTVAGTDLPADNVILFDSDDAVPQRYTVHLTHQTVTITPTDPGTPGTPVLATNPDGPKWPVGSDQAGLQRVVHETIDYVYAADGTMAAPAVTDTVTFMRTGTVDVVTGEATYTPWTAVADDTSFDAHESPEVVGYLADTAVVAVVTGLTVDSPDVAKTVSYRPVASYVPNLTTVPRVPYTNLAGDPTQVTTGVVPNVPGYLPYGPDGQPLQLVVAGDSTQGYVAPKPTDPFSDTPINYVAVVVPGGEDASTGVPERSQVTPPPAVSPTDDGSVVTEQRTTDVPLTANDAEQPANGGQPTLLKNTDDEATVAGSTSVVVATNAIVSATADTAEPESTVVTDSDELPQTDEPVPAGWSILGMSVLSALGLLGISRRRKRDGE